MKNTIKAAGTLIILIAAIRIDEGSKCGKTILYEMGSAADINQMAADGYTMFIVKGGAYGIVLTDNENKWWGGRIGEPKVAICPNCGEVSIYLENMEKLKNNEK